MVGGIGILFETLGGNYPNGTILLYERKIDYRMRYFAYQRSFILFDILCMFAVKIPDNNLFAVLEAPNRKPIIVIQVIDIRR